MVGKTNKALMLKVMSMLAGVILIAILSWIYLDTRESANGAVVELGVLGCVVLVFCLVGFFIGRIQRQSSKVNLGSRSETRFEKLNAVLESALDCVISIDQRGRVISFNHAAEECFGYKEEEIKGKTLGDLIVPPALRDAHSNALEKVVESGHSKLIGKRIEIEAIRANGEHFPVELTLAQTTENSGVVFYGFIRDIADRKADEKALKLAIEEAEAANKAKSDFLATVSHEMRTPLNVIIGMTDLMLGGPLDGEQQRRLLQVNQSGEMLLKLINQVLDLSRIESGIVQLSYESQNLSQLIQPVVELFTAMAEDKGLKLSVSIDDSLAVSYLCAPHCIMQMMMNLVGNAIKFTNFGTIEILVNLISTDGHVDLIRFEVHDDGIGLSEEQKRLVFDKFYQANSTRTKEFQGTGLGLAIARELVDEMGGKIGVESESGVGSNFWFEIELKKSEVSSEDAVTAPLHIDENAQQTLSGMDILVVEDNSANLSLVLAYLKKLGCEATAVTNGKQAIEAATVHRFDAILMDVQMPVIDGVVATRHIRREGGRSSSTPIIALTANVMPEDVEEYTLNGVTKVLAKPLRLGELVDVLSDVKTPHAN